MEIIIMALVRHFLGAAGAAAAAKGWIGADDLTTGIGAVTTLVAVGMSVYDKVKNSAE